MRDREYFNLNSMEAANSKTGGGQKSNELADDLFSTVDSGSTDDIIANNLRSKLHEKNGKKYDLDHLYNDPKIKGTLLHYVAKKDLPKAAEVLIKNGANPDSRDLSDDKYCPLHYAAEKGHKNVMKTLLDEGANPNATDGLHWRCSLHLLVENFNKWKKKDNNNANPYNECLDILLKRKQINVNIMNKDRITPIFLAASKKWNYMTSELIKKGANLQLLGRNNIKNIDHIKSQMPELVDVLLNHKQIIPGNYRHYFHELKESIKKNNIGNFKNILEEMEVSQVSSVINSEEDQGMTILQYACKNGLPEFVDVLLNHNADPGKFDKTNLNSPILYACEKGFSSVLEVFEKQNKLESELLRHTDGGGETVLHKVVKQEYKEKGADYNKCLEILLRYKIDVDAMDIFGNTPLHHAALKENQNLAKLLLVGGAHLGIKNKLGIMAITNIKPSVLEEVLNNSIKLNQESDTKERLQYKSMEVILNYRMFVPTNGKNQPETECIKFLSSSHAHRHLLRHPVINTFLSLKWQKISKYYKINLLSYIFYLFLLTAYILIFHGTVQDLDTSTTTMKTADSFDIQHRFSDNLALNISVQPIITSETNGTEKIDDTADLVDMQHGLSDSKALKISLQAIITLITICIGIKELIQLFLSWQSYISSFKNWLEIAIVIMTFVLLFAPITPDVQQSLSAWIVLISWTIFILILGCHPSLAIYITMFRRVTHNFTKLIFLFSFMIGAFSLSFYLIFQADENFITIQKTIMKTIAMSTGELEYTELPLAEFPVTSHILFVLFIMFILLVIMNLINGLAVSDIHMIQLEAEIYSYKNRVELISYLESAFLTYVTSFGGNSCSNNFMTRLLKKIGPSTLLMFPTCLRKQSIKMFPNNNRTKKGQFLKTGLGDLQANQTSDKYEICTCDLRVRHNFSLEESQIESTMSVVRGDKIDVAERINKIEDQLAVIDRTIEKTDVSCHVNNVVDRITQIENRLTNLDTTIASLTDILKAIHTEVTNK